MKKERFILVIVALVAIVGIVGLLNMQSADTVKLASTGSPAPSSDGSTVGQALSGYGDNYTTGWLDANDPSGYGDSECLKDHGDVCKGRYEVVGDAYRTTEPGGGGELRTDACASGYGIICENVMREHSVNATLYRNESRYFANLDTSVRYTDMIPGPNENSTQVEYRVKRSIGAETVRLYPQETATAVGVDIKHYGLVGQQAAFVVSSEYEDECADYEVQFTCAR